MSDGQRLSRRFENVAICGNEDAEMENRDRLDSRRGAATA